MWYRAPEILLGESVYSCPVDIWSLGCIVMEMWLGRPLFSGDSEIDQILRIFRVLGTPSEATWPGVMQLPDFKASFPVWAPGTLFPPVMPMMQFSPAGLDLLRRMFLFDPAARITAKLALGDAFFADQ